MNLSSLATNALATTRSTFKGLAEAAVAADGNAAADTSAKAQRAEKADVKTAGQAESTETRPKGVRRGTVLDAYA